ncbi:hypothetical protein P4S72_06900 [Vibrio sp. PP-XX7]
MIAPASVVTAETLSLDSLTSMVSAAGKATQRGASLIKIKLDQQQIIESSGDSCGSARSHTDY